MGQWQLQEAKQHFSELIREVEGGEDQFITKHGQQVAVVINIEEYRAKHQPKLNFVEYVLSAPKIEEEDWLPERSMEQPREIDW